jgi:hypothetical protein
MSSFPSNYCTQCTQWPHLIVLKIPHDQLPPQTIVHSVHNDLTWFSLRILLSCLALTTVHCVHNDLTWFCLRLLLSCLPKPQCCTQCTQWLDLILPKASVELAPSNHCKQCTQWPDLILSKAPVELSPSNHCTQCTQWLDLILSKAPVELFLLLQLSSELVDLGYQAVHFPLCLALLS